MATGIVKKFSEKGFGFISPSGGGKDIFVHQSDIVMQGYRKLQEGQRVTFDVIETDKGQKAVRVEPIDRGNC